MDEYFDIWGYAQPNALSLLGANLQLAEDRIPSLLGVLYSGKNSDSIFDAPFEFEAELSVLLSAEDGKIGPSHLFFLA